MAFVESCGQLFKLSPAGLSEAGSMRGAWKAPIDPLDHPLTSHTFVLQSVDVNNAHSTYRKRQSTALGHSRMVPLSLPSMRGFTQPTVPAAGFLDREFIPRRTHLLFRRCCQFTDRGLPLLCAEGAFRPVQSSAPPAVQSIINALDQSMTNALRDVHDGGVCISGFQWRTPIAKT
jgi:hypothetical protein